MTITHYGVQSIYNQQTVARNIDKEFCNTNGVIVSENEKTRFVIDAFKQLYQTDRYNDLARENIELKNKINVLPLECAIGGVAAKLDSVIGCAGVRTCGNSCGCNNHYGFPNYAVPPVGTFEYTKSYNPNVPVATA